MDKNQIRKNYIEIRKNINYKEIKSSFVTNYVLDFLINNNYKVIALYNSTKNEVDTHILINKLLELNFKVCLPTVDGDIMNFFYVSKNEEYNVSSFGIEEPKFSIDNLVSRDDIDVFLVPGICFDLFGNRIGYGKGYYDRFINNDTINIGLCFSEQIYEKEILSDEFDVKMKYLITDKGIIFIGE